MSLNRWAKKRDTTEPAIIEALEKAGWKVWQDLPVDLLLWKEGHGFRCMETKTARNKAGDPVKDKRRVRQSAFIAMTATPVATSPEAALRALEPSV